MNDSAFPIIGIGASAGGIDAFHSFFNHMPADCGMAFVMILHLPADRKSMLAEILARWTPMRVLDVVDGTRIEPNCVYVPPPHAMVTLCHGHLVVRPVIENNHRLFRPIDGFFDSLAAALMDLVSCRNLLIYMDTALHAKVIPYFIMPSFRAASCCSAARSRPLNIPISSSRWISRHGFSGAAMFEVLNCN